MIILLVISGCIILYKTGAARWFLGLLVTSEPLPVRETYEPPADEPQEPEEGRAKWETEARYILAERGQNPETVQLMGDEMLKRIIREYLDI